MRRHNGSRMAQGLEHLNCVQWNALHSTMDKLQQA